MSTPKNRGEVEIWPLTPPDDTESGVYEHPVTSDLLSIGPLGYAYLEGFSLDHLITYLSDEVIEYLNGDHTFGFSNDNRFCPLGVYIIEELGGHRPSVGNYSVSWSEDDDYVSATPYWAQLFVTDVDRLGTVDTPKRITKKLALEIALKVRAELEQLALEYETGIPLAEMPAQENDR